MALLLDTHFFLWLMLQDKNISLKEQELIAEYAKNNQLLVSAISIWEIAFLVKLGRVHLYEPTTIEQALKTPGLTLAPLTPAILCESVVLPGDLHKDPADRMIVATARLNQARLLTRDGKILEYAKQGFIDCVVS